MSLGKFKQDKAGPGVYKKHMENDRLARLETLVSQIELRLKNLEQHLTKPMTSSQGSSGSSIRPMPVAPRSENPPDTKSEKLEGGIWLAAVGILFFVLAASFFIKLAIDSGWLTPARQLCGAVLFGFSLIGLGARLKQRDLSYATFLPAAGLIVLFMAVFGGHLYWSLYSRNIAVVLVGLVALFALYLFRRFQHDFFIIASVCGSYSLPILLERRGSDPFELCAYFFFWNLLYCFFAIALGKRLLIGLTAYLALGVWHLLFDSSGLSQLYSTQAAIFQALQFSLLVGAVAVFSVRRRMELSESEAWALFPALLLFYAIEYALLSQNLPEIAPWLSLGFGVFVFGLYTWARNRLQKISLSSEPVVVTFFALTLFHALYLEILPGALAPWLALGLLPVLGWLPRTRIKYERFWPVYFLLAGIIVSEYFSALLAISNKGAPPALINCIFFALLFWGYCMRRGEADKSIWLLSLGVLQFLVGLQRLAENLAVSPENLYLTSGAWAVLGVAMLVLAGNWKDALLARTSMGVLGLVAAKVLFVDIGSSGSISRVIALIVIGALLYMAGLMWRRVGEWKRS